MYLYFFTDLIVGKEFQNNYGIPESNIAKFVSSGTFGDDRNLHTSSSAKRWSVAGFDIPLEKLLGMSGSIPLCCLFFDLP